MDKVVGFFKNTSPLKFVLISIGLGILAKFIERKLPNLALGLQLISFILFFYAIIKFFNKK
jgi:hypothetical protein